MIRSTNLYSSVDSIIPAPLSSGPALQTNLSPAAAAGGPGVRLRRREAPSRALLSSELRDHTRAQRRRRTQRRVTEEGSMDTDRRLHRGEDIALNKAGIDIEALTSPSGKVHRPININHYATKKSAAQSMLDVALLMANSSQLKTVLFVGPHYRFYIPLIVLLSLSIALQVIVGLLLVFIVKYDLNDVRKHRKLNAMNNVATVFVFFTVLVNIFITALGFEGHIRTVQSQSPVIAIPEPKLSPLPVDLNITGGI